MHWQTASEVGTAGFNLYRLVADEWVLVNTDGLIPARGAPRGGVGASYAYIDVGADPAGTHTYRLVEIETGGGAQVHCPFERAAYALRLVSPLTVQPDGSVAIRWLSRAGDLYRVYRSTSLLNRQPLSSPFSINRLFLCPVDDRGDENGSRFPSVVPSSLQSPTSSPEARSENRPGES